MKLNYQLTVTLVSLIVLFSISCGKGSNCEEPFDITISFEINVVFKDGVTGNYLYSEITPIYNKDSLRVFDELGNSLFILSQRNSDPITNIPYWEMSFGNIYNNQTDGSSFNSEVCKNFIVKYSYNEVDTLIACFRATRTQCGSVFEPINVFHKGTLIGTISGQSGIVVTVIKD